MIITPYPFSHLEPHLNVNSCYCSSNLNITFGLTHLDTLLACTCFFLLTLIGVTLTLCLGPIIFYYLFHVNCISFLVFSVATSTNFKFLPLYSSLTLIKYWLFYDALPCMIPHLISPSLKQLNTILGHEAYLIFFQVPSVPT